MSFPLVSLVHPTLTKSIVNNDGNIEIKTIEICGRKIPLIELRQNLLKKHEEYMHLTKTTEIQNMTKEEILAFMKSIDHEVNPGDTHEHLQTKLRDIQHTRTLAIWHDHSTILHTGYILFAIWVIYDRVVFLTEAEYKAKSGKHIPNIQAVIEEP